jgi:hypothetical protein
MAQATTSSQVKSRYLESLGMYVVIPHFANHIHGIYRSVGYTQGLNVCHL